MLLRFIIFITKLLLIFFVIGIISGAYVVYHYSKDLPDYSKIKEYYPPSTTRLYSSDGKLMEEYAYQHRIFVPISAIPKSLSNAFISAEDRNFYHHVGIDFIGIARAALNNVYNILHQKRMEGGSTITQQVVKNFLLSSERSFERKIKEAILSYMITQIFTKDEILELYLNQIYLGKGAYGVATAALHHFNKSIEELSLSEAATLASLPKAPSKYSPEKNYERAFSRKNYVLKRMLEDGYITEQEAEDAMEEPIKLVKFDKVEKLDAPYYAERVREEVIGMFGQEYFYTAGLTIITCADSKLQTHASESLKRGIIKYDKSKGYRGSLGNIGISQWEEKIKSFPNPQGIKNNKIAVILDLNNTQIKIGLKDGNTAQILVQDISWASKSFSDISYMFKIGDVILVENIENKYFLHQIPKVNGAMMIVENETGRVLASQGGYDFNSSKFDRTTQAQRQPGSLFKSFVYLAALESGIEPNQIFEDEPIEIEQGPDLPLWEPKNHDGKFLGPVTMRRGLEKSRNAVTVRVSELVGIDKIISVVKKFDIHDNPPPFFSMMLGALETTLSKMTLAYGTIANGGSKIEPHYIELIKDRKGNVIYKRDYAECLECKSYNLDENNEALAPKIKLQKGPQITDEATSYQMTSMLIGTVQNGTSKRASGINRIIAGKTGTTNDAKDAWFVGYTPKIVAGIYVGYDDPRSLGEHAYGSNVALPIFVDFMKNGYKDETSIDFIVPDSIKLESIDPETGLPKSGAGTIIEAFKISR